eukprot:TRINITY_DN37140_c0_g1_i1.p1 TRINITY_DN37140_c0_g1~~TRINITY_DN37140_c0_g1_i1.p1  ORF type:complete len:298 (-),score=78.81 TRINITY_DN37140_c0_g1_i1:183-1076(-)
MSASHAATQSSSLKRSDWQEKEELERLLMPPPSHTPLKRRRQAAQSPAKSERGVRQVLGHTAPAEDNDACRAPPAHMPEAPSQESSIAAAQLDKDSLAARLDEVYAVRRRIAKCDSARGLCEKFLERSLLDGACRICRRGLLPQPVRSLQLQRAVAALLARLQRDSRAAEERLKSLEAQLTHAGCSQGHDETLRGAGGHSAAATGGSLSAVTAAVRAAEQELAKCQHADCFYQALVHHAGAKGSCGFCQRPLDAMEATDLYMDTIEHLRKQVPGFVALARRRLAELQERLRKLHASD